MKQVLEEAAIVSEVTFSEGANGTSSVVGQFVPEFGECRRGRGADSGQGRGERGLRVLRVREWISERLTLAGMLRDAKEATMAQGRRAISRIAAVLQLSQHHVDAAQRFFSLAVQHNFIQGRRLQHVVAACLYIVCRRERTAHMLLDFAGAWMVTGV